MAVPEFYRFMRPCLEALSNGRERHWSEVNTHVSSALALSADDLAEMIPSGVRTRAADRILWSLTHLRQVELISRPARGRVLITQRGLEFLKRAPSVIRTQDLEVFPESYMFTVRQAGVA